MSKHRSPQELEAENTALHEAIRAYLSEFDNPVPDYTFRRVLQDKLRQLTGAPSNPSYNRERAKVR